MSMNADDLIAFLQTHFPDAFIQAANQGNKFDVRVVDASFEGGFKDSTVQRYRIHVSRKPTIPISMIRWSTPIQIQIVNFQSIDLKPF